MYTKVSVLVPTRGRPDHLRTLLASYAQTLAGSDGETSEVVFRVDDDDIATRDLLAGHPHRVLVGPRLNGYASMATFYNDCYAAAAGDVLLCGNDDMIFKTPGWAPRVLEAANRYPDGLFDFGVTTYNETHYPFSIIAKKAADRLGWFWDPDIFWGDIYLRDVMAAFGRSEMLPTVEIVHNWQGDEHSQNQIYVRDPTYWTGTHARAVERAVAVLADLKERKPLVESPGTAVMISYQGIRVTQSAQCFDALTLPSGSRREHFASGIELAKARERLATECTGDWLFFVDDDTMFAPDLVQRLLTRLDENPEIDIVAAFPLRRWPPHYSVAGHLRPNGTAEIVSFDTTRGLAKVDLTGLGGGAVIRRSAFTRVPKPWFTGGPFTEDWTFCARLKAVGGQAAVDMEAPVGHVAQVAIWPSFEDGAWGVSYVPLREGPPGQLTAAVVQQITGVGA